MPSKSYVVTAESALVYNADRSAAVTLAKGAVLPADSDPEHVKLLLERKLIEEGEAEGGVAADPDVAPPFPLPEGSKSGAKSQPKE